MKKTDVDSPLKHFTDIISTVSDSYKPEHPFCHPAYSLAREFPNQITTFDTHASFPKKDNSPKFLAYVQQLNREISLLEQSSSHTLVFSDGSYPSDPSTYPTTAAFRILYEGDFPVTQAFSVQHSTIAEAELSAMSQGIRKAIRISKQNNIVLFADSRASLTSLLNPKPHPAQSQSLLLIAALRIWLGKDTAHTITIRWCPSHSGVVHNKLVDKLCAPTSVHQQHVTWHNFSDNKKHPGPFTDPPELRKKSIGFLKQQAAIDAGLTWTQTPNLRCSLLRVKVNNVSIFDKPAWRHGGGPLMRLLRTGSLDVDNKHNKQKPVKGNLSTDTPTKAWITADASRLVRLLTNHAPIGAYRIRFHPSLPYNCPTCPGYVQSRAHILFHCARYRRPTHFEWFTNLQDFLAHKDSLRLLLEWLSFNPLAFTFAHSPSKIKLPSLGYGICHPLRPPD